MSEFKNGDLAVYRDGRESSMIFKIDEIGRTSYTYGNEWGCNRVHSYAGVSHSFRHATPEEIKAGRRLP